MSANSNSCPESEGEMMTKDIKSTIVIKTAVQVYADLKQEIKGIMRLSAEFMALWFASNYLYNSGLASTSVSSSTVLSNTSSIWVYIVSLMLLKGTKFDFVRAAMILFSFAGVIVITMADNQDSDD